MARVAVLDDLKGSYSRRTSATPWNDEDLNAQASRWLEGTPNVRWHGTRGERPVDGFERDEREGLRPWQTVPTGVSASSPPPN